MAYGKTLKKNFYSNGSGDIEMPPLDEMPPVLAETPQDWAGSQQQVSEPVEQEEQYESEAIDDNSSDDSSKQQEEVAQSKPKGKSVEENMARLRQAREQEELKRERAERERDVLMSQMLEMQRQMQYNQQKQIIEPEESEQDFDFSIDDDALLEGKHVKKLVQELKNQKKQLKQYHSQSSDMAIEAKIKANYPDFNDVVSSENIQRLNQEFPEIAQTLKNTPDMYNKAVSAYSIMKRFGIHKDRSYDEDKMKAIKNAQKPKPLASVSPQQGDSPLSKANAFANGLTSDLKKQMLKEMADARRSI